MKQQIIVSGIGGQGVLFLTRVIAQAAVNLGLPVLTSETHGMAQRGGVVESSIVFGEARSTIISDGEADIAIAGYLAEAEWHVQRSPWRRTASPRKASAPGGPRRRCVPVSRKNARR